MYPPQTSKYKIYIIDEVHMLSTSAFNALLKTKSPISTRKSHFLKRKNAIPDREMHFPKKKARFPTGKTIF